MPIDSVSVEHKQARMFFERLDNSLNKRNKLYRLRDLIDWSGLEELVLPLISVKKCGRSRKDVRVMLGVSMLQAMYNFSDAMTSEEVEENVYWQYFCGYEFIEKEVSISESTVRRFRDILGEVGYNGILKELSRVGLKVGVYKKKIWVCRRELELVT